MMEMSNLPLLSEVHLIMLPIINLLISDDLLHLPKTELQSMQATDFLPQKRQKRTYKTSSLKNRNIGGQAM